MARLEINALGDPPPHGSILMRSAAARLAGAMVLMLLLWLTVAWALL